MFYFTWANHFFFHLCSLGNRLPSLSVRQEEKSQQAEGHHGDRSQAVAGGHSPPAVWGREGCCQERYSKIQPPELVIAAGTAQWVTPEGQSSTPGDPS